MTEPRLALQGVTFSLPNGRLLFPPLTASFGPQRTALVGRNGVGKSVLAQILAGTLAPTSGTVSRAGRVHYLAQNPLAVRPQQTVAELAGIAPALQALQHIEQGRYDPADYELLDGRWELRQRIEQQWPALGLPALDLQAPAAQLSGGQAMRVALLGASLAEADFLILDEPSNHLDRAGREDLARTLQAWRGGLLLISHDRGLLAGMDGIAELSAHGLQLFGGNYESYRHAQSQQAQQALETLARRKLERQRAEQAMRQQQERQNRKQARGDQHGKQGNQAKILLDAAKERAQASSGKLSAQHGTAREALNQSVREAAQAIDWQTGAVHWHLPELSAAQRRAGHGERIVAELNDVRLPWPTGADPIHLSLRAGQRVALTGPNGCGKSTLLQVLAGQQPAVAGSCCRLVPLALLDQQQSLLQPQQSVLQQLQAANPRTDQALLRMRLAQIGLDARHVDQPSALLSGGERLKAALACALYRDQPAELLLLDEPDNHLDLPALAALQALLSQYPGTLVLVSHDEAFLQALQLTHRMQRTGQRWQLEPWRSEA